MAYLRQERAPVSDWEGFKEHCKHTASHLAYSSSLDLKCINGMSQARENSRVSDSEGFNEHCKHTAAAISLPLAVFALGPKNKNIRS